MVKLIPASPEQEGVWFHAKKIGTSYWNFVQRKCFKGSLNIAALKSAFQAVIHRHDSLRTNFRLENDMLYQVIHPSVECSGLFRHVPGDDMCGDEPVAFDLEKDILLRFTVQDTGDRFILTFVINHIVTDASSMIVFWEEMSRFYKLIVQGKETASLLPCLQYAYFVRYTEFKFFPDTGY